MAFRRVLVLIQGCRFAPLEPLLLIDALIKQIKLYNDKVEITFNTPTLQSPNDKGSFLMIKNKMKKIIQNKPQLAFIDMSVEFYV